MPKLKDNQVPSSRLREQSGQAIVTLIGRARGECDPRPVRSATSDW
jgi:hypothetical protein